MCAFGPSQLRTFARKDNEETKLMALTAHEEKARAEAANAATTAVVAAHAASAKVAMVFDFFIKCS